MSMEPPRMIGNGVNVTTLLARDVEVYTADGGRLVFAFALAPDKPPLLLGMEGIVAGKFLAELMESCERIFGPLDTWMRSKRGGMFIPPASEEGK